MSSLKRLGAVFGALLLLMSLFVSTASATKFQVVDENLESCIVKNGKLAVLMLIDESKSLRELKDGQSTKLGNDPTDSRVDALSAVVRVLASAVESSELAANANNRSLEVAVGIAGFGDGYNERLAFRKVTTQTVDGIADALELQREKDSDLHTRYHTALDGALKSFNAYSTSPEVCRLLVWFSDGEHDDDNSPGYIARERDQVQKLLCGEAGIVDQLRSGKVNIVAAGLNPDERKLGLMRVIAEGGAPYQATDTSGREGRVSVAVDRCGEVTPNGKYALAKDADQIIDALFEVLTTVPGIPDPKDSVEIPQATGSECPNASAPCNSVEFSVDENIASFQILAERPSSAVEVRLTTNEGQQYAVLTKAVAEGQSNDQPIAKNTVQTRPVTSRKVLISVNRKKENSIDGTWKLEFLGEGAAQSRGTVNFVGIADISLEYESKTVTGNELKVGRYLASDLGVRIVTKTSGSTIRKLDVQFEGFGVLAPLEAEMDQTESGLYIVSKRQIETALQSEGLKKASSVDLSIVPVGDVQGLKFKDGSPVPINFGAKSYQVRVSNGAGLPSFVRSEGSLSFEGTPKQKIGLLFQGPDSGDGFVTFGEAIESADAKAQLDLIKREACLIPQQTETLCEVELIPDQEAFGQFQIAISVTYSGKDSAQDPLDGEVPVDVTMVRQPSAGRGAVAAIVLLVIFLVIQGLVRLLLAYLVSRFAPLVPTARRVRLDALVDSTGSITVNPMHTNPSHSDEGFALENTESTQSFNVFGYQFSVSVLRTFLRSTVAPLGQVDSGSKFVVGSRGYSRSKDQPDTSTGNVSLTLRGQWVVGVAAADVQRLLNGESNVAAEVVAFLEPYEQGMGIERDQQLSDLSFGLASSSFGTDFTALLEEERERGAASNTEIEDEPSTVVSGVGSIFGESIVDGSDPFATGSSPASEAAEPSSKRRSKRGRGSRDSEAETPPTQESNTDYESDPFA